MYKFILEEHEELTREIYFAACEGSNSITNGVENISEKMKETEFRTKFFAAAHAGLEKAQKLIGDNLLKLESYDKPDKKNLNWTLRKLADSIAWQIIARQLYVARRFYRDQNPPTLSESNFASVVRAAQYFREQSETQFALISDLTSFVQIGDLIITDPCKSGGLTIAEVKEGDKNHQILKFVNFFSEAKCDRALFYFAQEHGKKGLEQMGRMFRQATRMEHITEIMRTDAGVDPDTKQNIKIRHDPIAEESYDHRINKAIEKSRLKGWAIDLIDDCLFLGAYSRGSLLNSQMIFNLWFIGAGGNQEDPICNLLIPEFCTKLRASGTCR